MRYFILKEVKNARGVPFECVYASEDKEDAENQLKIRTFTEKGPFFLTSVDMVAKQDCRIYTPQEWY